MGAWAALGVGALIGLGALALGTLGTWAVDRVRRPFGR